MAGNKKIIDLNQTGDRIREILDATDSALVVQDESGNINNTNLDKIWLTSFNETTDDSGKTVRTSIIKTQKLSELEEYISLNETTNTLNDKINDDNVGLEAQNTKISNLTAQVEELYNRIGDPQSTIIITPITPLIYSVQLTKTEDLVVKYQFLSTSAGETNGAPGKATWTVNDNLIKTEQITQNILTGNEELDKDNYNKFDFSPFANKGINVIKGEFEDSYGTKTTKIWTITTVDFSLEIRNFNEKRVYDSNVEINYYVEGLNDDTSATVFFYLDNNLIGSVEYFAGESTKSYILPKQPHGAHLLQVYVLQNIGASQNVISNVEYLDIMFVEEGKNTPIISWPYNDKELILEQYRTQDFRYFVYTPNQLVSNIQLISKLTYTDANDGLVKVLEQEQLVTSNWEDEKEKEMLWKYTPTAQMLTKTTAIAELTIKVGDVSKTKTFTVNKNAVNINPVTAGLCLDFNPRGRSNQDANYKQFVYEGVDYTTTMTTSENFDWVNGGWKTDENGYDVFLIKTGSRMYLDYPLFYNNEENDTAKIDGKHFKFTYKATNCATFNAPVMSCIENLGNRYTIQYDNYLLNDEGEIEVKTTKKYYLNGYNAVDATDSLLWADGIIGGQLITTGYEKDERDDSGLGNYITVTVKDSHAGVRFGAQEATLSSSFADLPLVYCEDEILSVSMDIEPKGDRKSLMTAYINMDPSRVVKYPSDTSFIQKNKQRIEFGSDQCDVYIYRFKAYERNFSTEKKNGMSNEIFDDYLADTLNADDILTVYNRNNILTTSGDISIESLQKECPDLRIILITCPRFTNDKNDKVEGCTVQHILPNGRAIDNWVAKNVRIKGQGTSSNAYGTSARNIDLKFNKYTINIPDIDEDGKQKFDDDGNPLYIEKEIAFEFNDNTYGTKYSMTDESIGVNYINIKVNVASSENANNACLAEWYNRYDPYVRDVKKNGVRDTMEFHPCVIFIKEENTANWQEFEPDGKFHFYACGDFGNSKKNHEVFGMDEDNLKECVVEISNNTHPITMFKTPDGWDDILPLGFDNSTDTLTEYSDYWSGDAIEFRYPEDLFEAIINKENKFTPAETEDAKRKLEILQPQVQRLWRWVQSTDTTTVSAVPESLALMGIPEEERYGFEFDSVEYRQTKFMKEYEQYFVKDSLLFQYVFTDRYLMIDNRAKNMFLHTVDGIHWDFTMDYDNDTSLGCENSGYLTLDYNLEDRDDIGGIPVYNGNDSVLWENVRTLLKQELEDIYKNDACKEAWDAKNLLEFMNNYQWVKPELLQMMDMQRKYIRPYKIGHGQSDVSEEQYLERLNGRKTYQRKRFETYRDIFTGSKYRSPSFESSAQDVTIRLNYNPGYVDITPYCDMYPYVKWGNTRDFPKGDLRVKAGQEVRIDLSEHGIGSRPNQEFHFCGATMLSDLGSLAGLKISEGGFSKCVKLKKLYVGDHTRTISSDVAITNFTLPDSALLEEFDISNTKYDKALDFTKQVMLKKVYTADSEVTSVSFAPNGFLEEAELNAISSLTAEGLTKLTKFTLKYDLLTKVNIKNTPYLTNNLNFISNIGRKTEGYIEDINVYVPETSIDIFDNFIENSKSKISLSGYANYEKIFQSQKETYADIWPNLVVTYKTEVRQYNAFFKDEDGTLLYTDKVTQNEIPTDPIAAGKMSTPTKEPDATATYRFDRWDGDFTTKMTEDRTFYATYISTPRKYTVKWYKKEPASVANFLLEKEYNYGEEAVFEDTKNELQPQYDSDLDYYILFKGWDKSTGFIRQDIEVFGQWEYGDLSSVTKYINGKPEFKDGFDTKTLNAAQIYTIAKTDTGRDYFAEKLADDTITPSGSRIAIKMGEDVQYPEGNKIIENPIAFNGTNHWDTGIQLFKEDKDWTLFLDVQFADSSKSDTVIASCYNDANKKGFEISRSSSLIDKPLIKWNGADISTSTNSTREVYVLRHSKGTTTIDIFEGALDKITPKKQQIDYKTILKDIESTLIFGASYNIESETYYKKARGIAHYCELWDTTLGDNECTQLVMWPRESIEFDIAGFKGYEVGLGSERTNIDFFASQLLWPQISTYKFDKTEYDFNNSYVNEWLTERFFKALPVKWRSIINKTRVDCTNYNVTTQTSGIKEYYLHLWTPAIVEFTRDTTGKAYPWNEEGTEKKIYAWNYSRRLTPGVSMVSTLFSSDEDNLIYRTADDPSIGKENFPNGSIWIYSTNHKIYYQGLWFNWGREYSLRSIKANGDYPGIPRINTIGSVETVLPSSQTANVAMYVLPCFSL